MKFKTESTFLIVSFIAITYAILGFLGLTLAIPPGFASPVFPASGLALVFVLHFNRRALPGIWLGSYLLNAANSLLHGTFGPNLIAVTAIIATGAAIQAWAGAWLVKRWKGESWRDLDRDQNAFGFLLLGGIVACLLSASISVSGLILAGIVATKEFIFTWWNWYIGDTLGVLVFAPLIVLLFIKPTFPMDKQRRNIVAPMFLILTLVVVAFYGAARWEKQSEDIQLETDGEIIAKQIADRLITHREVLTSLRNFIETIEDFSFVQFEQFTSITLHDNPDIFALSYNDLVTLDQRLEFEGRMSRLSPLGPFRITERDSQKRLVDAAARPEYVTVRYIVPLSSNKAAVGFDINSEPVRRDAIQRAMESRSMSVTSPIQLVQEQKQRIGVLELMPISMETGDRDRQTAQLLGFAVSVVKVDEMVEIATKGRVPSGLVFRLTDPLASEGGNLLYSSEAGNTSDYTAGSSGSWTSNLRMGDRNWELSVFPTGIYRQQHRPWIALAVGVIGLLFTALLQLLLLGIAGRAAETQQKNEAQKAQEIAESVSRTLEARVAEEVDKNREKDSLIVQQEKLASLGQLAAGIAHEINNPMGYIMSNLGVLAGYTDDLSQFFSLVQSVVSKDCTEEGKRVIAEGAQTSEVAFILDDIRKLITESSEGAERVKRIVLDLKDFSRSDEVHFLVETDLNQCVRSTVNIVRNEIKYVADLELHLGELPSILCNPQQINQVIANLLVNAAHAIDGHGVISVTTAIEGDRVVLTVADTGRGIPLEIRNKIYDPFFTTKEVGKGTGLGLSISYDIVKKHGGEIGLESEPGVGTTFTVRLPVKGPGKTAS